MSSSSLLWLLQPPEGQPRWLFGSMHIRDKRVYQFGEKLYPILAGSDVFIGEMELEVPFHQDPSPSFDLKAHLPPSAYMKMRKQLKKTFSMDLERYIHLHPMMALSAISQSLLEAEHQVSLDEHLWNFAKENGIPTSGLESYEEQMNLLNSIDPVPFYRQLVNISKSPSGMRKQTLRALTRYMKSDIHQLYRLTKSSMQGLRKRIIYERNRVMAQRISALDPAQSCFIVVGAGHLSGKYGILALIKKHGWKIRPVDILPAR